MKKLALILAVVAAATTGCGNLPGDNTHKPKNTVKKASGVITLDDPASDPATDVEITDAIRNMNCSPIGITRGNYKVTVYCTLRRT